MSIFLTRKEKEEIKKIKYEQKNRIRRLTSEDYKKLERAEQLSSYRRDMAVSIISLIFSIFALIIITLSKL